MPQAAAQHDHAPRTRPTAGAGSARSCSRSWPRSAIAAVLSSAGGVESGDVADVEDAGTVSKQDFDHWLVVVSEPQPGQKKPSKPSEAWQRPVRRGQAAGDAVPVPEVDRRRGQGARPEPATDAEVKRQFEQTKDQSFPNDKAYQPS